MQILVALIVVVLLAWVWSEIFHKAGYSRALGLLMVIPPLGFIAFIIFAFSDWPTLRNDGRSISPGVVSVGADGSQTSKILKK